MNSAQSFPEQSSNGQIRPDFDWDEIDTVFLDLDGTLLDKYFDDYFWENFVPQEYAAKNGVSLEDAKQLLLNTYRSVQNTLAWTDLDYWSDRLDLDVPGLKMQVSDLVALRPEAEEFLRFLRNLRKEVFLVTNAHPKTLAVKMQRVPLLQWFDGKIGADDIGYAKEQVQFWSGLQEVKEHDKIRTLFIDDNERVLTSANTYGIGQLVHIAYPSSRQPLEYSATFPSIARFTELMELPGNKTNHL